MLPCRAERHPVRQQGDYGVVLYFGAIAVIDGEMTVGALVAFNMIMGQATAPILRLSQLWQDFQQVQISVERLGDILNAPPESRQLAYATSAAGARRDPSCAASISATGPTGRRS